MNQTECENKKSIRKIGLNSLNSSWHQLKPNELPDQLITTTSNNKLQPKESPIKEGL